MDKGEIPEDANEHCPGPQAETAGRSESCAGCPNQQVCASGAPKEPDPDLVAISERMATVKHKILVLSCKGGVGKSTFASQLSFALAGLMDHQVGLMDLDICGPSMPKMLGLEGQSSHKSNFGWEPVYVADNLGVMSISFKFPDSAEEPAIWRGPRKNGLIKEFLKDVYWRDIDYLVVDTPPGTSDEHITISSCLSGIDGAIIVTTPQEVAMVDVRKGVNFCKKAGINVLGVVENMSGLVQPLSEFKFIKQLGSSSSVDVTEDMMSCLRENAPPEILVDDVFVWSQVFDGSGGGAERMCEEMGVPFLGKVPLDPQLCRAAERGKSCFEGNKCSVSAPALRSIIEKVVASINIKEDLHHIN